MPLVLGHLHVDYRKQELSEDKLKVQVIPLVSLCNKNPILFSHSP